jgi:flagellar motor switch protein FliG
MDPRNISGSLKAAILIRSLGAEMAGSIFNSLSNNEKQVVQKHLDQMGAVSADVIEFVAKEFMDTAAMRTQAAQLTPPPATDAEAQHNDADNSEEELEGLKAIEALDAEEIFELIKDEHPQTIAIILIHLKTPVASDVLSQLSDDVKTDVSVRVGTLDKVNAEMVEEVNAVFKEILKNKKSSVANISGGIDRLAEILNQTDEISSELILNEIEENDAEMAAQIKQKMFVFEDLILVDDRGFQKLLRKVETVELAIALKAASEEVKDKVFRNMSERAGSMLQEEMDDLGPVRMKEVSDAQNAITNIIQEMEAKGEIIISGRRGEEIIT